MCESRLVSRVLMHYYFLEMHREEGAWLYLNEVEKRDAAVITTFKYLLEELYIGSLIDLESGDIETFIIEVLVACLFQAGPLH